MYRLIEVKEYLKDIFNLDNTDFELVYSPYPPCSIKPQIVIILHFGNSCDKEFLVDEWQYHWPTRFVYKTSPENKVHVVKLSKEFLDNLPVKTK